MNEYVNKTINYTLGVNWRIEKKTFSVVGKRNKTEV